VENLANIGINGLVFTEGLVQHTPIVVRVTNIEYTINYDSCNFVGHCLFYANIAVCNVLINRE